jgi:hypothetical protein
MNFNEAKIINVYYTKGDRKPYDINGKPIAYIGEEFVGATGATTLRFHFGEDLDSSVATIVTKRGDGEKRLDILTKVGTGATSYYEVTLNEWYGAVKGKAVVIFKAYNGEVTFDDEENPTEITSVSGRIVVSDIFNLDIAYAPVADLVVPPDASEPYEDFFFALSTKLDKADSITVAGALPTLTGDVYDDRYFYVEDEGVGRLYYINGSTAIEVVWQVGTLKLTATGSGELTADTGKISFDEGFGGFEYIQYRDVAGHIGQDIEYYGKAVGAIVKGEAVQFAGVQGNHYLIKKAVPSEINANPKLMMGIAKASVSNNEFTYVAHFGRMRNINTSAYAEGDFLWFASGGVVDGALTTTQPTAPNAKVLLAVVVDDANNGTILIRTIIEPKLDELQNVEITSVANGNVLSYDGSKWVNSPRLTTAETDIANIEDGTTIVGKANADKDGNEFDATYLKKASASSTYVPLSSKGVANGVAPLDSNNKIPSIHLPGGVDDIKEFADLASFPATGEASIIYVALDTNVIYRWSGSAYVEISSSLALGETSSTAFAGNRGVALETLTDNIVDGTQTLTDTRITNSAVGVRPLVVNAIASTTANLQRWEVNGSGRAWIETGGDFNTNRIKLDDGVQNISSSNNSRIQVATTGTTISRNIADSNPSLIVNQIHASSTGDIFKAQATGVDRLTIKQDGKVGIGTASPASQFSVSNGTVFNNVFTGGTEGYLGTSSNHRLFLITNFAIRQTITNDGLVGIGTTSPAYKFHVKTTDTSTTIGANIVGRFETSASNADVSLQLSDGVSTASQISHTAGSLHLRTANTTRLSVLSNGNVGIGTSSPAEPLTVKGNIRSQTPNESNTIIITRAFSDGASTRYGVVEALRDAVGSLPLSLNPSGGNVGIGTTSPARLLSLLTTSNGDGIQLYRNSDTSNDFSTLGFRNSSVASSTNLVEIRGIRTNAITNNDSDLTILTQGAGNLTEKVRVKHDGLVGINETTPTAQLQVKSGATDRVGLMVDSVSGYYGDLLVLKNAGNIRAIINANGIFYTAQGIHNISNANNAQLNIPTTGTIISRNIADSNPALIVNLANASASGNIQVWQKAGSAKAWIDNNGNFVGNNTDIVVYETTDSVRTTSTYTTDLEITDLEANAYYEVEFVGSYYKTSTNSAGFRFGFTVSNTTGTPTIVGDSEVATNTTTGRLASNIYAIGTSIVTGSLLATIPETATTTRRHALFKGVLYTGTSTKTLRLQTATSTTLTNGQVGLKAGSFLKVRKVS